MNFYEDFVIQSHPTGSNYICNPPVTNTDVDTVILVKSVGIDSQEYTQSLIDLGWEYHQQEGYDAFGGSFTSWRKGNKNYIVTTDPQFYAKFVKATKIAKALNLLLKADRVKLFKYVMEGTPLSAPEPQAVPIGSTLFIPPGTTYLPDVVAAWSGGEVTL